MFKLVYHLGSFQGSQVVTSKAVGTMKAADDVEGPSTNMFKKASLSLVQECSETVTANNNRESSSDLNCRRINNRNVYPGCSFDAKQKVDVLQLYRIKDSTSSTTSNATQYQVSNN